MSVGAAPAASSGASSAGASSGVAASGGAASSGAVSGGGAVSAGPAALPSASFLDIGGSSRGFGSANGIGAYGMSSSSLQAQIDSMNAKEAGKNSDLMTAVAAMMLHKQAFGS